MDSYTQFKVRVTTSSRREYVKEKKKGELEMAVREKPKEGKDKKEIASKSREEVNKAEAKE